MEPSQKWEYATAECSPSSMFGHLNNMAKQGWRLVHLIAPSMNGWVHLVFEREVIFKEGKT